MNPVTTLTDDKSQGEIKALAETMMATETKFSRSQTFRWYTRKLNAEQQQTVRSQVLDIMKKRGFAK